MKTAAIYCRVSTSGQAKGGTSLDSQLDSCKQYALQQGYTIFKEVQEDVSGAQLHRAGLDAVRDMAATGELQAVVVRP